jgi:glutamate formiminotransferase/formiminotetrahydrofolate cyclodeaminase
MNLTNIDKTPIHIVFDEVCEKAHLRGAKVTGSELVGLIPLKSILDAGKYFLKKQNRSVGIPESDIIDIAVESLGLNQVKNFSPKKNIIEYYLDDIEKIQKLSELSLNNFSDEVLRESPAPGGGSVSSCVGALGFSLAGMVANLSCNTRGWEKDVNKFSEIADEVNTIREDLLKLVDDDANAFSSIMSAYKLPNSNEKEKKYKSDEINKATIYAAEVPLNIMKKSFEGYKFIRILSKDGNQNSISDAGVACLCVHTAIHGAYLNVMINIKDLDNSKGIGKEAKNILSQSEKEKENIIKFIQGKI